MNAVENKPWILPFLMKIKKRPGMYLGAETVEALAIYINGYATARRDLGLPDFGPAEETLLVDFGDWLQRRHGHNTRGCWGVIEKIDTSNKSVRTFLDLFDEFLRSERNIDGGLGGE